jgi:DNA-binding response OmpR family regulator
VRKTCNIGIIFLTAKSDIETKSESFGNGADDYVTKPFKMEELIMRIEALSMRLSPQDYFIFEDIYLNSNTKEGKKGDTPIHLTPNEWLVIDFLLSHHHRVVQRADIIEHVW